MVKIQDRAEEHTRQYLKHFGHCVECQPEGTGRFPDFRVDERVGVEVTILDRRIEIDDRLSNRQDAIETLNNFFELLPDLGSPVDGVSWFVRPQFKRPFVRWSRLKPAVERTLRAFQANSSQAAIVEIDLIPGKFCLTLIRASNTHSDCFLNGAHDDGDFGGYFLAHELKRNIELCICRKTRKRNAAALAKAYSEWWLILYDLISHGSYPEFFRDMRIEHNWDRVVLLDPQSPTAAHDLPMHERD
jgi:hypothetical protein